MLKLNTGQILASIAALTPEELEELQQLLPQETNLTDTPSQNSQLAVGNYNISFGSPHGSYVSINPSQNPLPKPRTTPPSLLPRRLSGDFVGREKEIDTIIKALKSHKVLEIYGAPGIGKTSLLSHLAYHEDIIRQPSVLFPDGVVYFSVRRKPLADLLQAVFDAFYESDASVKFTNTQIRSYLIKKQALIILDDVHWEREEVEELLDSAPNCSFLLFSSKPHLCGKAQSLPLAGLTKDDAESLIRKNLGKEVLKVEEKTAVEQLYTDFKGYPLPLLQISALAVQEGISLQDALKKALDNSLISEKTADPENLQLQQQIAKGNGAKIPNQSAQENGSQAQEQPPGTEGTESLETAASEPSSPVQERLEQLGQAAEVCTGGLSAVKHILEGNWEDAAGTLEEAGEACNEGSLAGKILMVSGGLLKHCTNLQSEIVSVLSALHGQGLLPEQIAAIVSDMESEDEQK